MDAITTAVLEPGKSFPLGASLVAGGANFSVFSKHASAVQLLLFDGVDDDRPSKVINLDPRSQRTYHYWHVFVPDVRAGQLYGYRVHGPYAPDKGLHFASAYGDVRSVLEQQGSPIGPLDTLIGSHALSLDAILVTHNMKEFSRIEGLRLEDWVTS